MGIAAQVLAVGAVVWLAAVLLLWVSQERLIFPGAGTERRLDGAVAAESGFAIATATTRDGLRIAFLFAPPRPGMPVIIHFHGNGEIASDPVWSMRRFAARGYGVVLAEYRGYGGNPGSPSEAGILEDGRAQVQWAATQWPGSAEVFMGESLGSAVAIALATESDPIALVLDSAFTSGRELGQRSLPLFPVRLLLRHPFDSLARIARVRAPALIIAGEADHIVPPDMGRRLLAAEPCAGSEGVFLPGVRHLVLENDPTGRAEAAVLAFLGRLPAAGRASCPAGRS